MSMFSSCTDDEENIIKVKEKCNPVCYSDDILCSSLNVEDAIKSLNMGKSPGMDGITPEHLRYAGPCICKPLLCFLVCLFMVLFHRT